MAQKNLRKEAKPWWVYIILASNNSYYTGITTDVARRWNEHLNTTKGAKFFRGRKPLKLVFVEPHADRSAASAREAAIKKLSRQEKILLLGDSSNQLPQQFSQGLALAKPN